MITERDVAVPGATLRCLFAGLESSPVVLCLHGFPDFAPSFVPMIQALAKAGYRAVAPFLRGYAPSSLGGPFHAQAVADDIVALARAVSPSRPVRVVGHDWGAVASYVALARSPGTFERAVTMAVPHPFALAANIRKDRSQLGRSWYIGFFQLPFLPERAVAKDDFAFIDRLWDAWSPGFVLPAAEMRALKACLAASMPAPIAYYRAIFRPVREVIARTRAFAKVAGRIACPTLLLMGENDGCIAAGMAEGQPRFFTGESRVEVVQGAGHFLHLERPSEVTERAVAWLAG